jgi:hypothetical protein
MEKIEAAIGEGDGFSGGAPFGDEVSQLRAFDDLPQDGSPAQATQYPTQRKEH